MQTLTNEQWLSLEQTLKMLKVKPIVNVIHAGDASKPTGLMIRVSMNEKFGVAFTEETKPEPQFKRKKKE